MKARTSGVCLRGLGTDSALDSTNREALSPGNSFWNYRNSINVGLSED